MVVNNITSGLKKLGFSDYEAKAWIALLKENPSTPYEVARESGIPTSKIYEVLSRLETKEMVTVTRRDKKSLYAPTDYQKILGEMRDTMDSTLNSLEQNIEKLSPADPVSFIWNLDDYGFCIEKAVEIAAGAKKSLLISGYQEELHQLKKVLTAREKEGLPIATVHFGELETPAGMKFQHPIEKTIYSEKGGRGFVIVADGAIALMATVQKTSRLEGAWSESSGFVNLAEDYIKHDIYIMKIVKRFDKLLKKSFGEGYQFLRDVFNDEEAE